MGKLSFFDILIGEHDNSYAVCYAGEHLIGRIVFVLDEPKKLEKITLEIRGKARTHWTRHHGKSSTSYSKEEYYFNEQIDTDYVREFSEGKLNSGRHEIVFRFTLPETLPSSFEGPHGHIRYTLTATLERAWKWNIVCKRAFTVIAREDLRQFPELSRPVIKEVSEIIHCCCFDRGDISIAFNIPKSGYVPGEAILISCDIINNSRVDIDHIVARLKQYVLYKGDSFWGTEDKKETSVEVARLEEESIIPAGETGTWRNKPLVIPPLPPRLVGSSIIDVSYVLKFDVNNYIELLIPIILGTVPISTTATVHHQQQQSPFDAPISIFPSASATTNVDEPPPPYDKFRPPTYRECVMGQFSIEEEGDGQFMHGAMMFAPIYPVYALETTQTTTNNL